MGRAAEPTKLGVLLAILPPGSIWRNCQNMDLHIDVELQGGLLLVTAAGNLAFEAELRLLKQVFDRAKGRNKILVNGLAVDGKLTTLERYRIGVELAAYLKELRMNLRVAIADIPPAIDGFSVLVAQNRYVTTEMFSSVEEALGWLDKPD